MSSKEIVMLAKQKYDELIKQKPATTTDVQSSSTQTDTEAVAQQKEDDISSLPSLQTEHMFVQQGAEDGIPGSLFTDRGQYKIPGRRKKERLNWLSY